MKKTPQQMADQAQAVAQSCSKKAWDAMGREDAPSLYDAFQDEALAAGLGLGQRALAVMLLIERLGTDAAALLLDASPGQAGGILEVWARGVDELGFSRGGYAPRMLLLGAMQRQAEAAGQAFEPSSCQAAAKRQRHGALEAIAAGLSTQRSATRGQAASPQQAIVDFLETLGLDVEFYREAQAGLIHHRSLEEIRHCLLGGQWDERDSCLLAWDQTAASMLNHFSAHPEEAEDFGRMALVEAPESLMSSWSASRDFLGAASRSAANGQWEAALLAVDALGASREAVVAAQAATFAAAAQRWRSTLEKAEAGQGRLPRLAALEKDLKHKGLMMSGERLGFKAEGSTRFLNDGKSLERALAWLASPEHFVQALRDCPGGAHADHLQWTRRMHQLVQKELAIHGHAKLCSAASAVLESLEIELAAPPFKALPLRRRSL